MLTKLTMVIILKYIRIFNYQVVHLKQYVRNNSIKLHGGDRLINELIL